MLLDEPEKPEGNGDDWTLKEVEPRKTQSPTAALFKSMLVPGWGQIGNREYVKAGLVVVVEGALFARWLHFRNLTVDARAEFESLSDPTLRRQEFEEFEKLRNKRNLFGWLTGTAIFLSMIDAFVGAHLADFPKDSSSESQKEAALSLQLLPYENNGVNPERGWLVGVLYRF